MLMPVNAVFGNSIFDMRYSKCKTLDDPSMLTLEGKLYKTCNCCRTKARVGRRRRAATTTLLDLSDDDVEAGATNAVQSLIALGYDYDGVAAATAALSLSLSLSSSLSSSAAASTTSSDYFVDEPDPEPEP